MNKKITAGVVLCAVMLAAAGYASAESALGQLPWADSGKIVAPAASAPSRQQDLSIEDGVIASGHLKISVPPSVKTEASDYYPTMYSARMLLVQCLLKPEDVSMDARRKLANELISLVENETLSLEQSRNALFLSFRVGGLYPNITPDYDSTIKAARILLSDPDGHSMDAHLRVGKALLMVVESGLITNEQRAEALGLSIEVLR
ncbi:MAG: hypothetical protein PHV36_14625 [Elusimicrobiales bacterium]|nr:hypothetical protein [Elusimicrobiales bacterium]